MGTKRKPRGAVMAAPPVWSGQLLVDLIIEALEPAGGPQSAIDVYRLPVVVAHDNLEASTIELHPAGTAGILRIRPRDKRKRDRFVLVFYPSDSAPHMSIPLSAWGERTYPEGMGR